MNNKKIADVEILPVRDPDDFIKPKINLHPFLPNPYDQELLLCIAPIRSGKSTLISNLLHQKALWSDIWDDEVIIISNTIMNDATSRFNLERWGSSCHEIYDDKIIKDLIKSQQNKMQDKSDNGYCLILDDICGSISNATNSKKGREVVSFSTRFRHYTKRGNPVCILLSNQKFNDISTIMRCNATGVLLSGKIQNTKELEQIKSEYADSCGGAQKWDEMIRRNQEQPFSWLYVRLSSTPCEVYLNFKEQLF